MLSLADLRARSIRPVWQESVAVVQELVQGALAADGALPDLEHVTLIPNGDVVALPGSPAQGNPVRHAAVMLSVLLDGSAVPPELDQFVKRNTVESPQCTGLEDFARNLSFFERPGRRADVERLVERAMAAEQNTRADEELQRLKEKALEATVSMQAPPDLFATPERRRSRVPAILLAVVLLVVVIGLPVWWWRTRTVAPQPPPAPVAEAAPAAAAPEGSASRPAGGNRDSWSAGGRRCRRVCPPAATSSPAPQPSLLDRTAAVVKSAVNRIVSAATPTEVIPAGPAADAPSPMPAPKRTARRRRPAAAPAPPVPVADLRPSAAEPSPADAAPAVASAVEPKMEDVPPAPVVDETVYSRSDGSVLPPVLVRPVLPKDPPPGVPADQIGTMEVLVDRQGDVERVKLISPGNRFRERMLVSAAKMWKFRPAFKDGHPVRYLTRVRLTI